MVQVKSIKEVLASKLPTAHAVADPTPAVVVLVYVINQADIIAPTATVKPISNIVATKALILLF